MNTEENEHQNNASITRDDIRKIMNRATFPSPGTKNDTSTHQMKNSAGTQSITVIRTEIDDPPSLQLFDLHNILLNINK
jgi:hypothetical protein